MSAGSWQQTRIGNAEREAAQRALQEHLVAGRLDLDEFGERSAQAALARTGGDLERLFADLPEPHGFVPTVAQPPPGFGRPSAGSRSWRPARSWARTLLPASLLGRLSLALASLVGLLVVGVVLLVVGMGWWLLLAIPAVRMLRGHGRRGWAQGGCGRRREVPARRRDHPWAC